MPTCGDHGGRTAKGKPCPRKEGWGTDQSEGRCKDHNEENDLRIKDIKNTFLQELSDPHKSMAEAAMLAGVDYVTIWLWRKADPEFSKAVQNTLNEIDEKRLSLVEDSLFTRIVAGKAAAAETLFWLMNRAPDRWEDKRSFKHSLENGDPLVTLAKMLGVKTEDIPE